MATGASAGSDADASEGIPEGRLVVVSAKVGKLKPVLETGADDPGAAPLPAGGLRGRVVRWLSDHCMYLVQSFAGDLFRVAAADVRQHDPTDADALGFDLLWPDDMNEPDVPLLCSEWISRALMEKGFCVIQTPLSRKECEGAISEAKQLEGAWMVPSQELEAPYLGRQNRTKYTMLGSGNAFDSGRHLGLVGGALGSCESYLNEIALLTEPVAPILGFEVWGKTKTMLRVPLESDAERQRLRRQQAAGGPGGGAAPAAAGAGGGALTAEEGRAVGHLNFLERRKLLMMLWVSNDGGTLSLHPKDALKEHITVPISQGKAVILRHDLMAYSYEPLGASLALQAWLVQRPQAGALIAADAGAAAAAAAAKLASVPEALLRHRVCISSATVRCPGDVLDGVPHFSSMFCSGSDTSTRIPSSRWDVDEYFSEDQDMDGRSYVMHGCLMRDSCLSYFDPTFFNITDEEAEVMAPSQRLVLEVGYDALALGGHRKSSQYGLKCGVFLGESSDDWSFMGEVNGLRKVLGMSNYATSSRLSHALGLLGPCTVTDTACSSSLVAINLAHAALRRTESMQGSSNVRVKLDRAVAIGCNMILTPRMYILYCGPHMLSARGRSFTFDSSADGYCRGEGSGGVLIHRSDQAEEAQEMLACIVGSCTNQDGKSASMTAPNGPAQQACIRTSMSESDLSPAEITMAECHGTGTALGDPIEVNALRQSMDSADTPILHTSAKSNIGHLEACAGLAGFIKCVAALNRVTGPPNAHLNAVNPHMDLSGYPIYFQTEATDFCNVQGISGVSSFGFGGTNARGDLWGRSFTSFREVEQVDTQDWVARRAPFIERLVAYGQPGPRPDDVIHCVGSWDQFSSAGQPMHRVSDTEFSFGIVLGEAVREQFFFMLQRPDQSFGVAGVDEWSIFPAVQLAGPEAEVKGPAPNKENLRWLIDGREQQAASGSICNVTLKWHWSWEFGEQFEVSWTFTKTSTWLAESLPDVTEHKHSYCIVGSWTSWRFQEMVPSEERENLWTITMRVGATGREEFQFARDADWRQVIYPALPRARLTSIPVRGPDHQGYDKNWCLSGWSGQVFTIQLLVVDGEIVVTVASDEGLKVWQSVEPEGWSFYFLTGTWNNWMCSSMTSDATLPGVHRSYFELGPTGAEEFQILIEQDPNRVLYPHLAGATLGEGILCGPDRAAEGMNWRIEGSPGQLYEITLDLNEPNRFNAVRWRIVYPEAEDALAIAAISDS